MDTIVSSFLAQIVSSVSLLIVIAVAGSIMLGGKASNVMGPVTGMLRGIVRCVFGLVWSLAKFAGNAALTNFPRHMRMPSQCTKSMEPTSKKVIH